MHYFVRVAALCAVVSIFAATAASAAPFVSVKGFSLDPPAHWKLKDTKGDLGSVWTQPGSPKPATLSVISRRVVGLPEGEDALSRGMEILVTTYQNSLPGYKLITRGVTTLGGERAIFLAATESGVGGKGLVKLRQVITVHNNLIYVVTCGAPSPSFAKFRPVFDHALESFSFATSNGGTFTSPDGYTVVPPSDWTIKPASSGEDARFVEQGAAVFAANIGIHVSPTSAGATIEQVYDFRDQINTGLAKELPGFTLEGEGLEPIGANQGLYIIAPVQFPSISTPLWMRTELLIHNDKVYKFTCLCKQGEYPRYDSIFKSVLQSIQWTEPAKTKADAAPAAKSDK
ncbi:MAG: hypothetical protein ABIY70_21450 [Capsulimonas sp.]|uniref:hypothetical protein n=1 Tax=Capsulimonas sp. TaxID=2494211 RepID=UPI003266238B